MINKYFCFLPGRIYGKLLFLLIVLTGAGSHRVSAQAGISMANPISIPVNTCAGIQFTDYEQTSLFVNSYGNAAPDVWYSVTIPAGSPVNLSIALCGSDFDTYLHVLNAQGGLVAADDDSGCGGLQSSLQQTLSSGTYYIVAEGYSSYSGNLVVSVTSAGTGTVPAGATMATAINAGTFSASGSYTDTRSNADPCLGNEIGQPSNDIYYQFTLSRTLGVILSHCGSGFDTYMHLLNSSGVEITHNDDNIGAECPGVQAYIQMTLTAGTYYVVSEGYGSYTGNIMTTIGITTELAPAISYTSPSTFPVGTAVSLSPVNTGGAVSGEPAVTLYAGGSQGSVNGNPAKFSLPTGVTADGNGNIYVADSGNQLIRKITADGVVSTFAGSGATGTANGTGTAASFNHPVAVVTDAGGNVYVADQYSCLIRKITPAGVVSTLAGTGSPGSVNGTGTSASFNNPVRLACDPSGNIYVADYTINKIRKITPSGVVTDFAGSGAIGKVNGASLSASFNGPMGLAFDGAGNLYVADRLNYQIRKISPAGMVTTLAGDGTAGSLNGAGTSATFNRPTGLAVDASGNVYVTDELNNIIRKVTATGVVSTFAGALATGLINGTGAMARFNYPYDICKDASGNLYVAEQLNHAVRKITTRNYTISPSLPAGLVFDNTTGVISGIPTAVSPAITYTVTAYGPGGSSTTTLSIAVIYDPLTNLDRNWIHTTTYNEDGAINSESKVFFDNNGEVIQSQVKALSSGNVLATQPIQDALGRTAVTTLAAPINDSSFSYKENFVGNGTGKYNYTNFDLSKTNNPDALNASTPGTLGWYYSDNNNLESYQATTGYPYTHQNYFSDGINTAKNNSDVGEQLRSGSGHEISAYTMPVINELNDYLQVRNKFFTESQMGAMPTNVTGKDFQGVVTTDANGTRLLAVADGAGNAILSGRADDQGILTINNTATINAVLNQYKYNLTTVASSTAGPSSFTITSTYIVDVYKNNVLQYSGIGNNYEFGTAATTADQYEIRSSGPFIVATSDRAESVVEPLESTLSNLHYFNLLQSSMISVTGNYELYSMASEAQVAGNTVLPAGYYKLRAIDGTVTLSYSYKLNDVSYKFYNQLGQLIASIAPEGVRALITNGISSYNTLNDIPYITTNEYDVQGRLMANTSADAGRREYIYREDGNIRFSQNAEQRKTGRFSYTNYDRWSRSFESGEYLPGDISFTAAKINLSLLESTANDGGLTGGTRQSQVKIHYDSPDNSHGLTAYVQDEQYLRSAVSWTENDKSRTWYNYDSEGRISWIIKYINGLGTKTIDYTYLANGGLETVDYQKNTTAERFVHHYEYDADTRLVTAYTSLDGINKTLQAKYYYYLHGPLKRVELGTNLQGLDYTYTPQGWLKSINHPNSNTDPGKDGIQNNFAPDAFAMTLEYFPGDYIRGTTGIGSLATGTNKIYYNGNISGQSWKSLKPGAVVAAYGSSVNNPAMFTYEYDDRYQFNNNKYGSPVFGTNSFSESANINREFNLSYDAHGNINSLSRTDQAGNIKANFTGNNYHYQAGTNKLTGVDNYASYSYNELGEMTGQSRVNGQGYYLDYNVNGKVTEIYSDAGHTQLRVSFGYDESGQRISKTDHIQNISTYYVYDGAGNVLSVYDNNGTSLQQKELPLYASSRIGTYKRSSNSCQYELTDHLGNVRVVINQNKVNGVADVVNYSDYYPFGSSLTLANSDYRYGYQGQYAEADKETGWNNFDARMYDAVIGRWMSTDPAGQYYSPYVGMGNNPVSSVDPDGEYSWLGAHLRQIGSYVAGKKPEGVYNNGNTWGFNMDSSTEGYTSNFGSINSNSTSSFWNSSMRRAITGDRMGVSIGTDLTAFVGTSLSFEANWMLTGKDASFFPYLGVTTGGNVSDGLNGSIDLGFIRSYSNTSVDKVSVSTLTGWSYGGSVGAKVIGGADVAYSYTPGGLHTLTTSVGLGLEAGLTAADVKASATYNLFQFHTSSGRLIKSDALKK